MAMQLFMFTDQAPKKKVQTKTTDNQPETSAKGADTLGQKRKREDTTDSVPVKDAAKPSGSKAELERSKDSKSSTNTGRPPSVKKQKVDLGMSCVAFFIVYVF